MLDKKGKEFKVQALCFNSMGHVSGHPRMTQQSRFHTQDESGRANQPGSFGVVPAQFHPSCKSPFYSTLLDPFTYLLWQLSWLLSLLICITNSSPNFSIKWMFPAYLREVFLSIFLPWMSVFSHQPCLLQPQGKAYLSVSSHHLGYCLAILSSFVRIFSLFHCIFFLLVFCKNALLCICSRRKHTNTYSKVKGPSFD